VAACKKTNRGGGGGGGVLEAPCLGAHVHVTAHHVGYAMHVVHEVIV
jgi:hypothetical protein